MSPKQIISGKCPMVDDEKVIYFIQISTMGIYMMIKKAIQNS